MDIVWYGLSCFRLREGGNTIICDPYDKSVGMTLAKVRADIVTVSHDAPGHASLQDLPQSAYVISGPGEFEVGGVFVIGVAMHNPSSADARPNVAYLYDFDGLTVAHLGDLNYIPSQSEIDALGEVNVALVPVGGGQALNAAQASEVINLLEPQIVVPMHYKTPYVKLDLDEVDRFLKVMGLSKVQREETLRVSAGNLIEDQTQVVILEVQQQ